MQLELPFDEGVFVVEISPPVGIFRTLVAKDKEDFFTCIKSSLHVHAATGYYMLMAEVLQHFGRKHTYITTAALHANRELLKHEE